MPYLLLASTSPLLQSEYSRRFREDFPYRFFALSNLASMLGLILYPTVVEPLLTAHQQAFLWSGLYGLYVLAVAAVFLTPATPSESDEAVEREPAPVPSRSTQALWILLPACASAVMLSGTQYLSRISPPSPCSGSSCSASTC